jgi:hypothetical protein
MRRNLIWLAAGGLAGLILGLIIGWLVWPVQWTNAWPSDLSPEAKAQYLATVAEAYVYYGDAEAAEDARNRLFGLNDDLDTAIAEAQAYFADNPQRNSRIYINNLGQLAQGLGVESPDIIVDTPPAADEATAVETPAGDSDVGGGVRDSVNLILTLLAAAVLVGGGIFIIARLAQRRNAAGSATYVERESDGFDDEDDMPAPAEDDLFRRPIPMPVPSAADRTPRQQSGQAAAGYAATQREDYGFDDEHFDDDEFDTQADDDSFAKAGAAAAVVHEVLDDDSDFEEMAELGDDVTDNDDMQPFAEVAPAGAAAAEEPVRAVPAAPSRQGAVLKTFTVHYQAGIPDYDQSYSIMDPVTNRYIGECGMGVNLKNGILQNNPDNVIALDVWLVDKKLEKSYSSQSRVLFSEYVEEHKLQQSFTRERPDDLEPLVPQKGMTFQLAGPNLTLDCHVVEANYTKNGPSAGIFQSIKIDMTVLTQG